MGGFFVDLNCWVKYFNSMEIHLNAKSCFKKIISYTKAEMLKWRFIPGSNNMECKPNNECCIVIDLATPMGAGGVKTPDWSVILRYNGKLTDFVSQGIIYSGYYGEAHFEELREVVYESASSDGIKDIDMITHMASMGKWNS